MSPKRISHFGLAPHFDGVIVSDMDSLTFTGFHVFMGMIGSGEILLIFLVVLVLFGPKRLPEIARMLGKATEGLRRASRDFHDQVMKIADEEGAKPSLEERGSPEKETKAISSEAKSSAGKQNDTATPDPCPSIGEDGGEVASKQRSIHDNLAG